MKLIKPYCEILPQASGLDGVYKQIEIAGRTCYKSEDKMTETSAEDFVNRMIKSGHGAMLEHGTVYLKMKYGGTNRDESDDIYVYTNNKYSKYETDSYGTYYITTNLRVLVENGWLSDLRYFCDPEILHKKRVTVRFVTSIGITRELIRHRVFSFANESTRYCNYSRDKFGNEITFIKPSKEYISPPIIDSGLALTDGDYFEGVLQQAEFTYFELLDKGWKPEEARDVLPLCTKSEIIMTGFVEDWKHFFLLRCDKAAHPDMQYLANSLKQQFIENGIRIE